MAMSDGDMAGDAKALVADAAHTSAERTLEAIDAAAAKNDDPVVAEFLDEAALSADATASRVGWLRRLFRRTFSDGATAGSA
jgi:hypothetical protein